LVIGKPAWKTSVREQKPRWRSLRAMAAIGRRKAILRSANVARRGRHQRRRT
jgi:hypothetical protein